jgi:hypothetical protein
MGSHIVRGQLIPPKRPGEVWRVKVICPYCGKLHFHGLGPNGTLLGARRPDCSKGGEQYEILIEQKP